MFKGVVYFKSQQVEQKHFVYLQNVKGIHSDAQAVKDPYYILPTPDFTSSLISSFTQQDLALLYPATQKTF